MEKGVRFRSWICASVVLHRRRAWLHRRRDHAALDEEADRAGAGDAEGEEGGSAEAEARQFARLGTFSRWLVSILVVHGESSSPH